MGTKFIITDDEGGDEPEPTPIPSGVTAVNSYIFRKNGDSYTISVKDKVITVNNLGSYIPINFSCISGGAYVGSGYIKKGTNNVEMYVFLNGNTDISSFTSYFDMTFHQIHHN